MASELALHHHQYARYTLNCQYRTRVLYATPEGKAALEAEYNDACGIRPAWAELVDQAGLVDFNLSETKTAFSITTRQQVVKQSLARLSFIAALRVSGLSSGAHLKLTSAHNQKPVAFLLVTWNANHSSMCDMHATVFLLHACIHALSLP